MDTALIQKSRFHKQPSDLVEKTEGEHSRPERSGGESAGMPLFLQRAVETGLPEEEQGEMEEEAEGLGVQAKLMVGAPDDEYERADRVTNWVSAKPAPHPVGAAPLSLQRLTGQGASQLDAAPDSVKKVLTTQGIPIDPALREDMEARFGHNFSRVRVHTDADAAESAHAVDALAYTFGKDIVFNAGQYSPHSKAGRALIAHELTHTMHQEMASSKTVMENPALEQEANQAALDILTGRQPCISAAAAAPEVQFLKVTSGGFGRALEEFTNRWNVSNDTIRLLKTSKTFMRLAQTLDKEYVARGDSYKFNPEIDSSGKITSGESSMPSTMIGKRELSVIKDYPAFLPVQSPDNTLSSDLIQVNRTDPPGFIQQLGHEVTHAANFAGASPPPAQSLVVEINAGIREEISTRQSEATILGEVKNQQVQSQVAQVGSRQQSEVEREIAPAIGMTYLESFFFARRLRDAQANDHITEGKARQTREVITDMVRDDSPVYKFLWSLFGEYGRVWRDRQIVQKEWAEFHRTNPPTDPGYDAKKEQLLQDHARRFFGGQVSYQKRLAAASVPATP